jgi:lipopolysaccharide/colanic/teichoic acid biosynthesis glycosyltransferase
MLFKESDAAQAAGESREQGGTLSSHAGDSLTGAEVFLLDRGVYLRWVKPALDYAGGIMGVVLAAPVLIAVAAVVWLTMGSPILLRQQRMGRFNVPFTLFKFRTMEPDRRNGQVPYVGTNRRITHKSADDPRITAVGRWLRATRLDELPQIFNVLTGDLSLVGPRPELVSVVQHEYKPWQHRRHAVKPGITGLWQISDRGDQRLHECTEMELAYLSEISLLTDLRIIAATVPAMARKSGI